MMSRNMALRRYGGIRFVLLLLLGLIAVGSIAGAGAWIYFNPPYAVTAYLQVVDEASSPLRESPVRDVAAIQRQVATYAARIKSQQILSDAIFRSDISRLDVVASKEDPIEWLFDALHVDVMDNGDIIEIAIYGRTEDMRDEVKLVDAVIDCFLNSVIFEQRLEERARQDDFRRLAEDLRKETVKLVAERSRREQEAAATDAADLEVFRREVANHLQLWEAAHRLLLESQVIQELEDRRTGGGRPTGPVRVVQKAFAGER